MITKIDYRSPPQELRGEAAGRFLRQALAGALTPALRSAAP
jgi:hypothetical protein